MVLKGMAKAIVAGLAAAATALGVAAQDGVVDLNDVLVIAGAFAGSLGLTWFVPNKAA